MTENTLPAYFRQHQVSPQWLTVLRAMAQVLQAGQNETGPKALFFKIGEHLAHDIEARFVSIETLDDLEARINAHWSDLNWGWVCLKELDDAIGIEHHACPLAEAFGDAALPWTVGLLEGYYQTIFKVLGAGESMKVQVVEGVATATLIHLRFGQARP